MEYYLLRDSPSLRLSSNSSRSFCGRLLLLLGGSLDVLDLGPLLALVHRAAGREVGLRVGSVLDKEAVWRGLEVHHGSAVGDLLSQAPGLQLDALGGSAEGGQGPALARFVDLALGGRKTAVSEV